VNPAQHCRRRAQSVAGEPDRLLSSFINGIKHLPCEFG
jgi:hypothetical protein